MKTKRSKCLYKNEWLSLYETPRGFIYAQRKGINSTAILCYRKNKKKYEFLVRFQPLPVLKNRNDFICDHTLYPCCVTGSIEEKETPLINCLKEVYEETNYLITKKQIKHCICATSSTQMNEIVYHYLVDLTGIDINDGKLMGDGSYFENISKNQWLSEKQLKKILLSNQDLYLSSLAINYLAFINKIK